MDAEELQQATAETIDIARYIDHTLLKPEATPANITRLCHEAKKINFKAVCVNSSYVELASKLLASAPTVSICCAVGFPLGAMSTAAKVAEARSAISSGADEIDMVIHVGRVKAGEWSAVKEDISEVHYACGQTPLKVIFETCLLNSGEIVHLCKICMDIGVAFVKTSTGFSTGGATLEDVKLMHDAVEGSGVAVKASGGIRDRATALAMIKAGASRLGTSSGVAIVSGSNKSEGGPY